MCAVCAVAHAMRAGGRLCHTRNTIASARAREHAQACHASPAPCRVRMPALWVAIEKHHVATPPLKTLLRHKFFCRDRNVPPLGKLCRDTRRPLSRPKPGTAPNPIATLDFCRDTGSTNLCRNKEGLCRNPNHLACLGTVSRHKDPYRDIELESSVVCARCAVARTSQPRAWP